MNAGPSGRLPLVLLGAGGHAKVVLSLARAAGWSVVGVCDPQLALAGVGTWREVPVLGDDGVLSRLDTRTNLLANGLGQLTVGVSARARLYDQARHIGHRFPALIHPFAWVDPTAVLAEGCQIMAGAVVQADAQIGDNAIINTGARLDHDVQVEPHAHIAPGATLCGAVHVARGAFVGAGATVIQGLRVGRGAVIGAGTTLRRSVADGERWLGPGR